MLNLIKKLNENGIQLSVVGDHLKVSFDGQTPPADILDAIRANKAQLIELLKKSEAGTQHSTGKIPKAPIMTDYPLSFAQKRLWLLSQFDKASSAYNIPSVTKLNRAINHHYLNEALTVLIIQQEILRTVFRQNTDSEPRQVILGTEELKFELLFKDFSLEQNPETAAENFSKNDSYVPFDLENGPLFRAALLQTGKEEYLLYFNMHHIICDAWSDTILIRDLIRVYEQIEGGKPVALQPLPIQYKDYAVWQEQSFLNGNMKDDLSFWKKELEGELPILQLPASKTRPPQKTYNGKAFRSFINEYRTSGLRALSQKYECSLFMTILSSLNVLYHKYSGSNEFIIGTALSGRTHEDLDNLLGFFINTIALRNELHPDESFVSFLLRVKYRTLESFEHQDCPLDRIVEELNVKSDPGRSVLFDTMLTFQNVGEYATDSEQLRTEDITDLGFVIPKYDLSLEIKEIDNGMEVYTSFNSDVYDETMIKSLLNHFNYLLDDILDNPEKSIRSLQLLGTSEIQEILLANNRPDIGYPEQETIIGIFEKCVDSFPESIAVKYGKAELNYRELNSKANQLAGYLKDHFNVGQEDLIGLLLDRNESMIISILGVLKTGAAYVPIDPTYPESRIEFMKNDSCCKAFITAKEFRKFEEQARKYSEQNLQINISPDTLAYVIYTSGTTGQPKGTLIEHKNVVRLFFTDQPLFEFSENDVWSLFHSYCFDFSVWEMYGALLHGGKLIIVDGETTKEPSQFVHLLKTEAVTVLNQTPSSFYNLIKEELQHDDAQLQLRYVVFGGEALFPVHLKEWYRLYPETRLINMYGITETTVHVTYKEIGWEEIESNQSNIGKAIPTTCCYVLDQQLNLLPVGIAGELYVGGAGVARGYLNREILTQERFIEVPFLPGVRIYKSGDNVRLLPNGEMEYLGRLDDQVKIRGHRIELAEIKNAILALDSVQSVIVLAHSSHDGNKELIGYYTAEEELDVKLMRGKLQKSLPEFMIPSHFIYLDEIPLTSNGKINFKGLPSPDGMIKSGEIYAEARTPIEEELTAIWQGIFKREKIGIFDDFFALGGHSIKAIKMIAEVQRIFRIKLEFARVLSQPTIAELAEEIENQIWLCEAIPEEDITDRIVI